MLGTSKTLRNISNLWERGEAIDKHADLVGYFLYSHDKLVEQAASSNE